MNALRGRRRPAIGGLVGLIVAVCASPLWAQPHDPAPASRPVSSPYARWRHGPPADPQFFPLCVWLQHPKNAPRYKALGINTYMGLWKGPTDAQLTALRKAGMHVICHQNPVGLRGKDDPTIIAWMHGDEPDNAQWDPKRKRYTGAVPLKKLLAGYRRMTAADPSRPVLVNFGQGVANDRWIGIGMKRDRYPDYCRAADLLCFDVYPVVGIRRTDGENYLHLVAKGVQRLRGWGKGRPVWHVIECTHISNPTKKATPQQVKAMAWMGLIHGARGLCYFVHQFKPRFIEAALLVDEPMCRAVAAINRRITALAPVLNGPSLAGVVTARSSSSKVPVHVTSRRHGGALYVFAVGMRNAATSATFQVKGLAATAVAEVLDENRRIAVRDGRFVDRFGAYDVHLYRIAPPPQRAVH
jgi:hypothetical protein